MKNKYTCIVLGGVYTLLFFSLPQVKIHMINNHQRPTCRAVVRPNEGGARIHPRGCRVRYQVQGNGSIRKIAKATGQMKPRKQTVELHGGEQFDLNLKKPGGNFPQTRFLWDTGASFTTMSTPVAKRMRLLTLEGNPAQGLSFGPNVNVVIADGSRLNVRTIPNAPLEIVRTGEVVRGMVIILPGGSSLFGVSHIRNVKTLKVKFRDT